MLSVTAASSLSTGWAARRLQAEEELLQVGQQFESAFASYYQQTPAGRAAAPEHLTDLLQDARQSALRRHLRRIPIDPLTGKNEWGVLRSQDGRAILGVYSLSPGRPVKAAGFPLQWRHFAGKASYVGWRFGFFTHGAAPTAIQATAQ